MKKETISLKDDVIITKGNVQALGEVIAIRAVTLKKKFEGKNLEKLQGGMLYDIYHNKGINSTYSDGYDVVQEAVCFLCNYIGRPLGEVCQKSKHGKGFDCIRLACYKHIYSYLRKQIQVNKQLENEVINFIAVDEDIIKEPEDLTRVNFLIEKMKLTPKEFKVLSCFYDQMTYDNIEKTAHIARRTISKIRKSLKQKYLSCAC